MDGFDFLRDAFKKFADKVDGQDIANRALRAAGAGGKALVDRGTEEFPHDYIKGLVESAYALLTSQEIAEGISMSVRAYDEEKIKELLDTVVAQLKEDQVATQLAKQVKEILRQASNDELQGAIEQLLDGRPAHEKMIFNAMFQMQIRPILDDLRSANEDELVDKIKELADTIPTDLIALQVGALTREITPERIIHQAHAAVDKLPSGTAIADIAHGVAKSASKGFDAVSKARSLKDVASALDTFAAEAQSIVSGKVANDQQAKKTFDKKGKGGFKF